MEIAVAERPRLAAWAPYMTCYTAAVCSWLSARTERWWRPVLSGGPVLALTADRGGWRFDHTARPLAAVAGLGLRESDDTGEFLTGVDAALDAGPVVVAGDVFRLPWQQGHDRWHAPHWFVLARENGRLVLDDALALTAETGRQKACRVDVTHAELAALGLALPVGDPVFERRERSAIGRPVLLGARHRWLVADAGITVHEPAVDLRGAEACEALADRFDKDGDDPGIYAYADDLWQAMRHRELVVAAAEADSALLSTAAREHWQSAVAAWRALPALLMHAKLRSGTGSATAGSAVATLLRRLGRYEDQHLIDCSEAERTDAPC
jgi:hypothetical protein